MDSHPSLPPLLKQLPSLDRLIKQHGDKSILEYAQKNYSVTADHSTPLLSKRKEEFLAFLDSYITRKFGTSISSMAQKSLRANYCVSTAEHHGPMGHPFFFQPALLRGLVNPDTAIVNLCTSHVSLGNSSYPRWCVFHGAKEVASGYLTLPFFPASKRMAPVFRLPAYTRENITMSSEAKLHSLRQQEDITDSLSDAIGLFLKDHVLQEEILECGTYSEQITRLNHAWWKSLFPDLPDFLPLDAEDIVSEILQNHLHSHTTLTRILTDQALQPLIEQCFNGISCCFDLAAKSWTYLFWHLDENHIRHALWREANELVSHDRSFRMVMDHAEIHHHLEHRHLIPSGLLVYVSLACYAGLTCFGGFSQGDYLPQIQQAYASLLSMACISDECLSTQPSILNEDLVFWHTWAGQIATALDMQTSWAPDIGLLRKKAADTTLSQALEAMAPEITRCL